MCDTIDSAEALAGADDAVSQPGAGRAMVAMVSGTSSEFIGGKPLPRAVRDRPLVVILGPEGVGKSSVGRRLLGQDALHIDDHALLDLVTRKVRSRHWDLEVLRAPTLILDGPCFLDQRIGILRTLQSFLRLRIRAGRRTVLIQPADGSSLQDLASSVEPDQRATIILRFPVGRGRTRTALRMCDELGIPGGLARRVANLDPWSYERVRARLLELAEDPSSVVGPAPKRRRRGRRHR